MSAQRIHLFSQPSFTILTCTRNISPHKRHQAASDAFVPLINYPNQPALHCVGPRSYQTSSCYVFSTASMYARVAITNSAGFPATASLSSFLHQSSQLLRQASDNGTGDEVTTHKDGKCSAQAAKRPRGRIGVRQTRPTLKCNTPGQGRPYLRPLIRDAVII